MSTATPTPLSHLSIAIVGVGRIGSAFAYQLARAGHQLTVVARPGSARLAQLQRDGGIVLTTGERVVVTVTDHLDEQTPYDLVIVTTNAHQVEDLIPTLRRSKARKLQFMFATIEAARIKAEVGPERTTFGFAGVLAMLDDKGHLELSVPKNNPKAIHGHQRWVELFQAAGMPSQLEPEMERRLRFSSPLTMAMEGVAIAGMQHKRGATWAEAKTGARALRAAYAILSGGSDSPYPRSVAWISRAPRWVQTFMLWGASRSRFRDAIGTSQSECGGLIELLTAEGRRRGVPTATLNALHALLPRPGRIRTSTDQAPPQTDAIRARASSIRADRPA
jgi:2-dehydropantoate 2-reductase